MLTINGKLVDRIQTISGESQRGQWVRGGVVIEYGDDYPKKVAVTLFGEEKINAAAAIGIGTMVQVKFNPQSREYNGNWYTDLLGISIAAVGSPAQVPYTAPEER